jgi:hypothetical protein
MNKVLIASLLASVVFCGCSIDGSPVHFVVPVGFEGPVRLILDPVSGVDIPITNGRYIFQIPPNGILYVKTFSQFEPMHVQTASWNDGTSIAQDYHTWVGPNGEPATLGPDAVVFQGGGVSKRNDDPEQMTFFIGSGAEYEELLRAQSQTPTKGRCDQPIETL